ncbi:methylated-DNA--[protein]-cysteine S-methyltransferase [bacterium]|nr:methylated-DNA--[protein]-cysteine S-methyltransferase [bacterium]
MNAQGSIIWREGDRWYGAVASDEGVLVLLWSPDRSEVEENLPEISDLKVGAAVRRNLERLRREINEYHRGKRKRFTVQAAPQGTEFQKTVWKALCGIPYGKSMTYGELAEQIGKPGAARAVGNAAGTNPVPIVIPCHRLLAANKKLGGFGAGPEEKRRLLGLEGIEWIE